MELCPECPETIGQVRYKEPLGAQDSDVVYVLDVDKQ